MILEKSRSDGAWPEFVVVDDGMAACIEK